MHHTHTLKAAHTIHLQHTHTHAHANQPKLQAHLPACLWSPASSCYNCTTCTVQHLMQLAGGGSKRQAHNALILQSQGPHSTHSEYKYHTPKQLQLQQPGRCPHALKPAVHRSAAHSLHCRQQAEQHGSLSVLSPLNWQLNCFKCQRDSNRLTRHKCTAQTTTQQLKLLCTGGDDRNPSAGSVFALPHPTHPPYPYLSLLTAMRGPTKAGRSPRNCRWWTRLLAT